MSSCVFSAGGWSGQVVRGEHRKGCSGISEERECWSESGFEYGELYFGGRSLRPYAGYMDFDKLCKKCILGYLRKNGVLEKGVGASDSEESEGFDSDVEACGEGGIDWDALEARLRARGALPEGFPAAGPSRKRGREGDD